MADNIPRVKGKTVSKTSTKGSKTDSFKKRKEVTKITNAGEKVNIVTTKYSNKSEKAGIKKLDAAKESGKISPELHKKLAVNTKKIVKIRGNETKGITSPVKSFVKLRK